MYDEIESKACIREEWGRGVYTCNVNTSWLMYNEIVENELKEVGTRHACCPLQHEQRDPLF